MFIDPTAARAIQRLPSGSCYQGAYLMLELCPFRDDARAALCHGVAVLTDGTDREFGHGWVEYEAAPGIVLCYDRKFPRQPVFRDSYYAVGRVREHTVVRYTWFEARRHVRRTGIYGPWDAVVNAAFHADD